MKKFFALLLALAMVLSLAACGSSQSAETATATTESTTAAAETTTPAAETKPAGEEAAGQGSTVTEETAFQRKTEAGTFTVGTDKDGDGFDPCTSTNAIGEYLVYETLVTIDPTTHEVVGQLAEEWSYQDDTHLYFKLREGATFSNGEPVTPEDVFYSFQRLITNNSRWSTFVTSIDFDNCEIINDREFVIAYYQPFGPGLTYLTGRTCSVLCKSYCESISDDAYWDAPIGSGPYTCVENTSGSQAVYQLREDYWDKDASFAASTITVKYYSEATTMFIDYENGVLDMVVNVDSADAERLVNGEVSDTYYLIQSGLDVYGFALPEYVEAFNDLRVRQAIACAVDWAAVTEIGLGVLGGEATSILPSGVLYKTDVGTYTYDPDHAKELLDEAGFDYSQTFRFVVINSPTNVRLAEAIQAYLAAVGVNVSVESYDWTTAVTFFMNNDTDFVINSMGCTSLDPDQQLDTVMETSTNGSVRVTEEPMVTYLNTGRNSVDAAVREEAYANAQTWMYENIRQVAFAEPYYCLAYRPYIADNFATLSIETPNFRYLQFAE